MRTNKPNEPNEPTSADTGGSQATEQQIKDESTERSYEDLFLRWSDRWERIIRVAIIGLLALLLAGQALLQWPVFRQTVVKVERLEGHPYPAPER
ncbi:hypothetical protein [Paenibacillus sp. HJGM_3]|uniref:hypothetical protein n=1 Tax=Paenibacillus sp. HJGM_3 TaxID=3379816 RepID=UPI0038663153